METTGKRQSDFFQRIADALTAEAKTVKGKRAAKMIEKANVYAVKAAQVRAIEQAANNG